MRELRTVDTAVTHPAQYSPGDHLTARCDICGVESKEPLTGEVSNAVAYAALSRLTTWIEAHYAEFHPEGRDGPHHAHVNTHMEADDSAAAPAMPKARPSEESAERAMGRAREHGWLRPDGRWAWDDDPTEQA